MIRRITSICIVVALLSNYISAQTVTASQTDSLVGDHQAIGIANPNDTVRYKTTIGVSGAEASGVNFNNAVPTNTTMVAGSVKTSALCRDDVFATSYNTLLTTGNVLTNDYGLPSVSVVSFGTTMSGGTTTLAGNVGTTNNGGTLTVNSNGTFSYQPMTGFSGMDQFTYIGTTGVAGLQNGSATVTINVATDITFTTMDTNPVCNGDATGSIVFSASGGTGALTYSITGAMGSYQMSPTFSGLMAGSYNLAVKDAVGYIKTGTTTLTNPPLITFSTMDVHNICNGGMAGSITFSAGGGTGTLTYSITGAMGSYQMSPIFSGLAAGTYNLAVKDANNCIVTGTTIITQPTAVTFTFTKTDITCNGAGNGSIVFNTTSGGTSPYTYSITGTMGSFTGSTSYPGLSAATYNLVAKDVNNCISGVVSTTVIEPGAIDVSGTIPTLKYNVAMSNAPFSKTGGTGSPANPWSALGLPPGVIINTATGVVSGTPTQTGSFSATITYTDANGCFDDLAITVMVGPNLVADSYLDVVGNTQLVADGYMPSPTTPFTTDATNILTNDISDAAITVTSGTFATVNGGSILIGTDGKFIYSPPVGNLTSDSYTYTGTSNGVAGTGTINFTFGAGMIWFVNNTYAGANGVADGRSHRPFTSVSSAETPSANGHVIYVHTGSGNTIGTIVLKPLQLLRGEGTALTVGVLGLSSGTKPTLSGMITLANSVTVDGFDMSNGATTAITSSGATGVNVSVGNVTTNGAPNAFSLTNTTGFVTIAGGSQTGSTGATVNISGGTVSLTYSGGITQAVNAPMVSVSGGHASGTITFNSGVLNATNGTGLQFNNADGTYNFNGTTTLNGGDAGIDITNGSVGAFTFGNCGLTNGTGRGLDISSSAPNVNYTGFINTTFGVAILSNVNGNSSLHFGAGSSITSTPTAAGNEAINMQANGNTYNVTFQDITMSGTVDNLTEFNGFSASSVVNFDGVVNVPSSFYSAILIGITAGTFNFNNTGNTITGGAARAAFRIIGGTSTVNYKGNISQANAAVPVVEVNSGHSGGTITFSNGTLSSTDGTGFLFDNADGTYNFNGTTTLNGGNAGIDIQNGSGGSFTFGASTSITSPAGIAMNIDGTAAIQSCAVTYNGNITQANNFETVRINNHNTGTITFQTGTLSATNGLGFSFQNGDGTYNFNGTNTLNGGDAGIDISTASAGTYSFSANSSITNPTNELINIAASTVNFTYSGTFTKNNNSNIGILINQESSGTININGTGTKVLSTGTGNAVDLTSNTGATINFSGNNLSITTTSGIGFNATGGGTINVTGTGNTITSTSGTALNISNATIGSSNLNFLSISASNTTKGIILNTTGSSGGLVVTGSGTTNASGGTISSMSARGIECISSNNLSLKNMTFTNACTGDFPAAPTGLSLGVNTADNAVIHLQNVTSVTLDNVDITGSAEQGINGHNVNGFNLLNSTITSAGNGPDEDGIHFFNMSGTCNITNTIVTGSGDDNFILQNNTNLASISTVGTLNITGGSFTNAVQGSGILFGIRGSFNTTINITGGTQSTTNFSGGIVADAFENCIMDLTVTGCTSSGNNDQLSVSAGDNSSVDLVATGNTLSSVATGDFVAIGLLGSALDNGYTFDANINSNNITIANGLTADGIIVNNAGGGLIRTTITGNTISYAGTQRAILIQQGQDGAAETEATVTGNNIDVLLDGANNAVAGILAQSQVASPTGDGSALCIDIGGATAPLRNTFTHSLGGTMAAGDIRVRQRSLGGPGSSTARMPGYAGGVNTALAAAHLDGRNTVVSASTVTIDDNMSGGAACQQPSF